MARWRIPAFLRWQRRLPLAPHFVPSIRRHLAGLSFLLCDVYKSVFYRYSPQNTDLREEECRRSFREQTWETPKKGVVYTYLPRRFGWLYNDFYWVSCLPVFCDKPKSKLHFMSDPFFITQNDKQQDPWWKIIAWQYLPKLENWPCKNLIKNNRFNLIDIE